MSAWFSRVYREFEAGNLTRGYRDVLLALGRFDGPVGIFPSHRTLAARARCGIRTVQRALQAARRLGLVEMDRHPRAWIPLRARNPNSTGRSNDAIQAAAGFFASGDGWASRRSPLSQFGAGAANG